ncbi:MAG: Thioredoxin C-1 [Candidatus Dependentiae bacterium ADurb.Bin331]|nr:MAG: Thioredoxin C-1 [Candidatus Dependentiae bacterium ADurb.Bin331]
MTDHRYRQAGVAAGDGIKAALDAVAFLQEHGFSTNIAAQLEKRYVSGVPEERAEIPLMKTVAEIKDIIDAAQGLVVIDFYAPHCPSCMRMLPAVEAVAHQFADQVAFLKVDTSISPEIAQEYHVPTIPCMLVFNEKQLVARYNQSMSRKQLEEFILKLLKDS